VTELIDYEGFCGIEREGEPLREKSAVEVAALAGRGDAFLLLDVREPDEHEQARIPGARLLPLGQLEARLSEIADWKDRTVVVHCRSGARSARACRILLQQGFADVWNLAGGIEAWSLTVDPRVGRG
jgi:adenylyltransferase/sulfurtransferase